MNCANHPQNPVTAYCRTCGKPLCANCTRPVMGVIYCENCLAERVGGTAPQPGQYQQPGPYAAGVVSSTTNSGPNPGLAGILGAIPFGVGAIYNNQYTKGLVHLAIFVFLVVALSSGDLPGYLYPVLGIGMAFFILYQIIDAVRTAKAIQAHQPPPDPFGLATMFSPGGKPEAAPAEYSRRNVPMGAVVLIGLGLLFLLHNLGFWFLRADVLWPLVLIGLGVWLLAKRVGSPAGLTGCGSRGLMGPAVLMTLGLQFLLNNLGVISFGRTLPVLLIVIGVILAIQRSSAHGHGTQGVPPGGQGVVETPANVASQSEVKNG